MGVPLKQPEAKQVLLGLLVVLDGVLQLLLCRPARQLLGLFLAALSSSHKVAVVQACTDCHSVVAQLLVYPDMPQCTLEHCLNSTASMHGWHSASYVCQLGCVEMPLCYHLDD